MEENKKKRKVYSMTIDETDEQSGVFAISLVDMPAIEENWVSLSKQHIIELKETAKRIVTGPVLIPGKQILRVDESTGEEYYITFDEQTIEKASQLYLKRGLAHSTTLEHQVPVEDVYMVESWIVKDPAKDKSLALLGKEYPVGSWIASLKIENNEIYNQFVQSGKVSGFSIEALLGHKRINASAATSEGSDTGSEGSKEENSSEERSKEEKLIEALKSILFEYLETNTSITSTNAGTFGSGSIITDAK
jgi:hypothetical protein